MLHTKLRGNRSTCAGEDFEGFLPYIGVAAVTDGCREQKPMEAPQKHWL